VHVFRAYLVIDLSKTVRFCKRRNIDVIMEHSIKTIYVHRLS